MLAGADRLDLLLGLGLRVVAGDEALPVLLDDRPGMAGRTAAVVLLDLVRHGRDYPCGGFAASSATPCSRCRLAVSPASAALLSVTCWTAASSAAWSAALRVPFARRSATTWARWSTEPARLVTSAASAASLSASCWAAAVRSAIDAMAVVASWR